MAETLHHVHVAYKKYKIKRKFIFFCKHQIYFIECVENIRIFTSARELKSSETSHVLRTRENSDVFNTLDEIYLVFTSKQ